MWPSMALNLQIWDPFYSSLMGSNTVFHVQAIENNWLMEFLKLKAPEGQTHFGACK